MSDIYVAPEEHGLVMVGEFERRGEAYEFDILACWRDGDKFYLGTDSGCSCPSPFENYFSRADLTGPLTREQALEEVTSLNGDNTYDIEGWNDFVHAISVAGTPSEEVR